MCLILCECMRMHWQLDRKCGAKFSTKVPADCLLLFFSWRWLQHHNNNTMACHKLTTMMDSLEVTIHTSRESITFCIMVCTYRLSYSVCFIPGY